MENGRHPVPGIDYPRTFQEMDTWFRTEAGCRDYVRRLRWPEGFVCRRCGAIGEPWVTARGVFHCRACAGETSLTAGTIFEGTRKPLRMWFLAMWFVTSQKNGVSALGLQRVLGLGSYETAWTWLHKLRRAMVRPGRDCLTGTVEVDETYVGGPEEGKRAGKFETKAIVVVAAEKSGRGIGRIRLRRIKDVTGDSLLSFCPGCRGARFCGSHRRMERLLRAGGDRHRRCHLGSVRSGPGEQSRGPVRRVRRGAYRAKPSRRQYIPKPDAGSGRWASPRWRTRSSSGRWWKS